MLLFHCHKTCFTAWHITVGDIILMAARTNIVRPTHFITRFQQFTDLVYDSELFHPAFFGDYNLYAVKTINFCVFIIFILMSYNVLLRHLH